MSTSYKVLVNTYSQYCQEDKTIKKSNLGAAIYKRQNLNIDKYLRIGY